jgi:hypothetical protein
MHTSNTASLSFGEQITTGLGDFRQGRLTGGDQHAQSLVEVSPSMVMRVERPVCRIT